MARQIQARITVQGKLMAMTPLHVGGYGESFDTDLPLARDGGGGFYVPGTSLAGPMRAWCLDAFDEDETENLWGFQEKPTKNKAEETRKEGEKRNGHASFVMIEDAPILNFRDEPLHDYETEIRDGVGINRKWGVAENQIKYDRAILPRGSKLDFRMIVDVRAEGDFKDIQARLGRLLQALKDGGVPFGAAKTRGLGRVCLLENDELEIKLQDRKGKDFLLHLRNGGTPSSITQLNAAKSLSLKEPSRLTVTIGWEPRGALMVKSGADGIGVDMLPLVSGKDGHVALVLPGSSVKGAFRSHAERIVRTLKHECLNGNEDFAEQLSSIPLISEMFGLDKQSKKESEQVNGNAKKKQEGGCIGAIAITDCYSDQNLSREEWQKVMTAKEKDLIKALDEIEQRWGEENKKRRFESSQHVAIDRWTGGAAESMLFSTLEPYGVSWEPIVLTLDLEPRRHARDDKAWANRDAALALLFLLLRDLVAGRVPLGFAVNRGMGEIKVNSIKFAGKYLQGELSVLKDNPVVLNDGDSFFNRLDATELLTALNTAWQKCVAAMRSNLPLGN